MEISLNQLRETYERYINLEQFLILGQEELTVEMETLCNIWEGEAKEAFRVSMQNFLTTGRYALLLEKTKEIQEILKKGIDGISEEMNRSDCFNQLVSGEMQGIGYYDSQRERGGYFISRDSGYFLPKCDELQNTTQEQKNYLRQIRQKISYQISPYHPLISKMEECERNTRELENVEEFKRSLQIYINEGAEIDDGLSKEFERLFGETYSIHEKQYAALGSYLTEENGKEKVEIEILEKYVSGEISVAQAYEMLTMLGIEAKEMIQERETLIENVGNYSSADAERIKEEYLKKVMESKPIHNKIEIQHQLKVYDSIFKQYIERNEYSQSVHYLLSYEEDNRRFRLDCSGFVSACLWGLGLDVGEYTSGNFRYGSSSASDELVQALQTYGFKWYDMDEIENIESGDIYCMNGHIGIAACDEINGSIRQTYDWGDERTDVNNNRPTYRQDANNSKRIIGVWRYEGGSN